MYSEPYTCNPINSLFPRAALPIAIYCYGLATAILPNEPPYHSSAGYKTPYDYEFLESPICRIPSIIDSSCLKPPNRCTIIMLEF